MVQWSNKSVPLGNLRALPAESPLWGENPEGVTDPRQGMKREARNPCSHGVKRENPERVTDHRQGYTPCVIDSGICRPFGQGFHFAPPPAWGLSPLRSGIPLRSIPCLGSVVPSGLRSFVAREAGVTRYALHRLPGVSSPLRGFPCRWGNSLPFREGLGVGFWG